MREITKIYETANNVYEFKCKVTAKTSYEEQQERKERTMIIFRQRLIIAGFISIMFLLSHFSKPIIGAEVLLFQIFALLIGVPVLITNKQVIG